MEILSNAQVMNLVKSYNQIAVIVKLQFKQIIIAEIKSDVCIGYKPFISKAVGNVFIKIAYQLIELNQKRYHWQNLDKFEKCDSL